jgi:hypothetical protein
MRRIRLAHRDRRALRLLGLVGLPIAMNSFVIRPYASALESAQDELRRERDLLVGEVELAASDSVLGHAIATTEASIDEASKWLFRGQSRPLAEAEMTKYVQQLAELSAVELRSLDVMEGDTAADTLDHSRINLRGNADLEPLMVFLLRLENGAGLARIRELTVDPASPRYGSGSRANDGGASAMAFALLIDLHYELVSPAAPLPAMAGGGTT